MKTMLVGYGTLLYRASLANTIGGEEATEKAMLPVVVRNYRRLFNLRPDHYESSFVLSDRGNENGALNVEPSEGSRFNGLAFEVGEDELGELDRRERYYERKSVEAVDFLTGVAIEGCQVYASIPTARWIDRDPQSLLPLWRDVEWSRMGAYAISREFGEEFDRTTYLADGTTLVSDHYHERIAELSATS